MSRRDAWRSRARGDAIRFLRCAAVLLAALVGCAKAPDDAPPVREPQRIVALGATGVYETLLDFGVGDRVVAVTHLSNYPGTERLARIGADAAGVPNVEAVLALSPDLVIAKESAVERLRAAGLRVLPVPFADEPDALADFVRALGRELGREGRADELLRTLDADVARLRAATAGRPRVRVYMEHPGPYQTKGPRTILDAMIDLCGGDNIGRALGVPEGRVSAEFVVQADPEVILLGAFTDTPAAAAARPGWSAISAVRTARVHQLTPDDRLLWSTRWPARAERLLLPLIHPDGVPAAVRR